MSFEISSIEKRQKQKDYIDLDFLESRIQLLKNCKYTLVVAGEVNAGKSTFINALLGEEILPSDVLQTTSAIVEIFKSEKSFLKIKYATGEEEEIFDYKASSTINESIKKLRNICSIEDSYREIPTTILDEYIIKHEQPIEVTDDLIKQWQLKTDIDLFEKKELIKKYFEDKSKDKIPVEIQFGYPLKFKFDELRIVDSPGVNALGNVQDISFRYFEDANAILFIHPIKPIESQSFYKFVKSVISNRSKETLFLVLTHAGLYPESDIKRLYAEGVRLYKNEIPEERILVIDSLLKLIYNELESGTKIEQIEEIEQKSDILLKFEKKAKRQNKDLKDILMEYSGFQKMIDTINKFSIQAPNLQLKEILDSIKKGYDDQTEQYDEKLKLLNTKKRNPQEFEEEINRISNALSQYKNLMHKTEEEMNSQYTGLHSEWNKKIDELKLKYPEDITKSETVDHVRKCFMDSLNEIEDICNKFSKSITDEFRKKLEETGKAFLEEHKITIPKVDLKSIEDKANKNAYRTEDEYNEVKRSVDFLDVITFGIARFFRNNKIKVKTGERKIYDETLYLMAYKTECNKIFYDKINFLPEKSNDVLSCYLKLFNNEINDVIASRQKSLEEEKNKKESNNELIAEIESLNIKKKEIFVQIQLVEPILEDLI